MEVKHYLGIELKLADFEPLHWLFNRNEWWKDIPGFEGAYRASTLGRIKSLDRFAKQWKGVQLRKGKILTPRPLKKGYLQLKLRKNDKDHCLLIHRIVMYTFDSIKNPAEADVNHKNLDKNNNCFYNLEYLSSRDNRLHYLNSKNKHETHINISKPQNRNLYNVSIRKFKNIRVIGSFIHLENAIKFRDKYVPLILEATSIEQVKDILKEAKSIIQARGKKRNFL